MNREEAKGCGALLVPGIIGYIIDGWWMAVHMMALWCLCYMAVIVGDEMGAGR